MCIAFGVSFFLPQQYLPMFVDPSQTVVTPSWQVYAFFGGILALTILGIILQGCLVAREISWDNVRKHVCPSARNDKYRDDELGTPLMRK